MTDMYDEEPWWKLGMAEWGFIIGLILLHTGFFVKPEYLDFVFQILDLRKWNGFTWFTAIVTVLFAVYGGRLFYLDINHDLDEVDLFCAKRFYIMSILIVVELWGCVLLAFTEFPRYIGFQIRQLFGYGSYSLSSLLILTVLIVIVIGNAFVIIRWAIAVLDRYAQ